MSDRFEEYSISIFYGALNPRCEPSRLCSLRPYFMGFRIVSLQIKIGDYERPIWRISFSPVLWGSKSPIWTISIFISITRPVFAQNRAPIMSGFPVAQNRDYFCNVCQAFMSDYMNQREGYWLVEKGALTLVISRSSRWHMSNIICWSAAAATACCISQGHVAQGPLLVARHEPFQGTAFLWSLTRELS